MDKLHTKQANISLMFYDGKWIASTQDYHTDKDSACAKQKLLGSTFLGAYAEANPYAVSHYEYSRDSVLGVHWVATVSMSGDQCSTPQAALESLWCKLLAAHNTPRPTVLASATATDFELAES